VHAGMSFFIYLTVFSRETAPKRGDKPLLEFEEDLVFNLDENSRSFSFSLPTKKKKAFQPNWMNTCAFCCFRFLNYNFPSFDLSLSVKTKEWSESFKQEQCDISQQFFLIVPPFPRQPWCTGAGEGNAWHSGGSHTPLLSRPGLRLIFYHPKATISSEENVKFKTICPSRLLLRSQNPSEAGFPRLASETFLSILQL